MSFINHRFYTLPGEENFDSTCVITLIQGLIVVALVQVWFELTRRVKRKLFVNDYKPNQSKVKNVHWLILVCFPGLSKEMRIDFWCHIIDCSWTSWSRCVFIVGWSEINQLRSEESVEHNVIWLDIQMSYIYCLVEPIECFEYCSA